MRLGRTGWSVASPIPGAKGLAILPLREMVPTFAADLNNGRPPVVGKISPSEKRNPNYRQHRPRHAHGGASRTTTSDISG